LAPDLFAGDAAALGAFRNALFNDGKFDPGAFQNRKNFFAKRNVTAIVIEFPTQIDRPGIGAWLGDGFAHAMDALRRRVRHAAAAYSRATAWG
jgi:hypothetical protein